MRRFRYKWLQLDVSFNRALLVIENILFKHNVTCTSLDFSTPTIMPEFPNFDIFDPCLEKYSFNQLYDSANNEQYNAIDKVIREVQYHDTGSNVLCLVGGKHSHKRL